MKVKVTEVEDVTTSGASNHRTRVAQPGGRPISAVALNFIGFTVGSVRFLWGLPPIISDVSVYSGRVLWGPPPKKSGTTVGQHWMGQDPFSVEES